MRFQPNKTRQLWLPIFISLIIVFTVSWFSGGNKIFNRFLGNDQDLVLHDISTSTTLPTDTPTQIKSRMDGALNATAINIRADFSTTSIIATDLAAEYTPESTPTTNCTFTIHFWKAYPGAWEIENITFGNRSYTKIQAIALLNIDDPNLATTRLMQQYIIALLNTLNGADPSGIERTLDRVLDWLVLHPPEIGLTQAESLEGEILADELLEFNTGVTGPGHCINEPFTPTPGATPTPYNYTPPVAAPNTSAPISNISISTPTATKKSGSKPKPTKPPSNTLPPPPTNTTIPATPKPTPSPRPPPTPEPTSP
jgi:hypothetical protein